MLIYILMRYAVNHYNHPANKSIISELYFNEASLYHIFHILLNVLKNIWLFLLSFFFYPIFIYLLLFLC